MLDVYDRRDTVDLDQFDPNNWNNILMRKNDIIHQQDIRIKLLTKKNYKLTQLIGKSKFYFKISQLDCNYLELAEIVCFLAQEAPSKKSADRVKKKAGPKG